MTIKEKITTAIMLAIFLITVFVIGDIFQEQLRATSVYADNTKCEDDHECYWAYHVDKPDQKRQCRHKENKEWKFGDPPERCGENNKDKKDEPLEPTKVVVVPVIPTTQPIVEPTSIPVPTDFPLEPTDIPATSIPVPTQQPTSVATDKPTSIPAPTQQPIKTDDDYEATTKVPDQPKPTQTNTPTATLIATGLPQTQTAVQPDCPWCDMAKWFLQLFERQVLTSEQQTIYMATQSAAQSTIAANR